MGSATGSIARWVVLASLAGMLLLWPLACSQHHNPSPPNANAPLVRVRLLAGRDSVPLRATLAPTIQTATEKTAHRLNLPPKTDVQLNLVNGQWHVGDVTIPGSGILTLWPVDDGTVAINGKTYRGRFRFVPAGGDTFDVINDVDIDSYLKGVVSRELLHKWNEETFEAQAIVARTYALYEARTAGTRRQWDVYPDQRSQVYGGFDDESEKSREAVDETSGVVVAYGTAGKEKIFKAYFSACCGGVTQSSLDAFNEPFLTPLCDQNVHGLCSAADSYNWGPIEIRKDELTKRFRAYGKRRKRGEADMTSLARLEIAAVNRFDRPIRFIATDAKGIRYDFSGEELRNAINAGASGASDRLPSSFMKIINEPGSDVIRFVEGHGVGHGVGMCQWCSEARAEAGVRHEDIVLAAFPRAKLVRAY